MLTRKRCYTSNNMMDNPTIIAYLKIIILLIGVVALGILAINQFFNWVYHIQIITNPCVMCEQYNNTCTPIIKTNLTGEFILPKGW